MNDPKISVVMATYNAERFIDQAIQSILAQTFSDFEFIIIDDGSTDQTHEILSKWVMRDRRICASFSDHAGLTRSLNKGLKLSRAPIIARMDADDISAPDRLARQFEFLVKNQRIAALGTGISLIDGEGRDLKRVIKVASTPAAVRRALRTRTSIYHPTVMFRAEPVRNVGGYREQLRYAQDYDLWFRLSERHELANLPEPLLSFRVHSNSISRSSTELQNLCGAVASLSANYRRRGLHDPLDGFREMNFSALPELRISSKDRLYLLADSAEVTYAVNNSLSHRTAWDLLCKRYLPGQDPSVNSAAFARFSLRVVKKQWQLNRRFGALHRLLITAMCFPLPVAINVLRAVELRIRGIRFYES